MSFVPKTDVKIRGKRRLIYQYAGINITELTDAEFTFVSTLEGDLLTTRTIQGDINQLIDMAGALQMFRQAVGQTAVVLANNAALSLQLPIAGDLSQGLVLSGLSQISRPINGALEETLSLPDNVLAVARQLIGAATELLANTGTTQVYRPITGPLTEALANTAAMQVIHKIAGPLVESLANTGALTVTSTFVTSGLMGWYDAGNATSYPGTGTSWFDLSGNSRTLTISGGPTWSSSDGGGSFTWASGKSATATYPNINTLTQASIMSIFKRPDTTAGGKGPISYGGNNGFRHQSQDSNVGSYQKGSYSLLVDYSLVANTYQVMCSTANSGGHKFYKNGVLSTSNSTAWSVNSDTSFAMGSNTDLTQYFVGQLAVGVVYNRALTAAEVLQNFNYYKTRFGL